MLMLLSLLPGQMKRERTGQPQVLVLCLKQAQHLLLKKKKKVTVILVEKKKNERFFNNIRFMFKPLFVNKTIHTPLKTVWSR